jgi:uncharacterized damage-inducible protein DinB
MADFRDRILSGFDYDLWANERWLTVKPNFQDKARAEDVLQHIWLAQVAWYNRIQKIDSDPFEEFKGEPADATVLRSSHDAWKTFLQSANLESTLVVPRQGREYRFCVADMAHHVLNHGTYHRGHLRGLAQAEGWDDFQETDYTAWLRETGQANVG